MDSLETNITEQIAKRLAERRESRIKEAIRETDWHEYAVLDVVYYHPPPMSNFLEGEIRIERYEHEAPEARVYSDGERTYDLQRITKPLIDKLNEDLDMDLWEEINDE